MSDVAVDAHVGQQPDAEPARKRLGAFGTGYVIVICAVAAAAVLPLMLSIHGTTRNWIDFAIFGVGAAIAQLFVVRHTRAKAAYHAHGVFLIPAALLLPIQLVALIAQQRSHRTLERLCATIAERLLADYELEAVWVKAAKPEPPIALSVDEVSVEVWREADG